MAKTSLYLPDDLAEQVRAHGISISEVAQAALRKAVQDAQIKENVMTDIQAVAERLRANRGEITEADRLRAARARAYGDKWARTAASADDLGYVALYNDDPVDFRTPVSLAVFVSAENEREYRAAGGIGLPGPSGVPTKPGDGYWADFQTAARNVWNAVLPLLSEQAEQIINPEYRRWLNHEPMPGSEEHARWVAEKPPEFL